MKMMLMNGFTDMIVNQMREIKTVADLKSALFMVPEETEVYFAVTENGGVQDYLQNVTVASWRDDSDRWTGMFVIFADGEEHGYDS